MDQIVGLTSSAMRKLDEEARQYAVAELICSHLDEFEEFRQKHMERLYKYWKAQFIVEAE